MRGVNTPCQIDTYVVCTITILIHWVNWQGLAQMTDGRSGCRTCEDREKIKIGLLLKGRVEL